MGTLSALKAALRHGGEVASGGHFKRDQAFRVAIQLGYEGALLDAFIRGFGRQFQVR